MAPLWLRKSGVCLIQICVEVLQVDCTGKARFSMLATLVALSTAPAASHDIYTHLTDASGRSCCDGSDCRPASYKVSSSGVQMYVHGTWIWVPRARIQYRSIEGDTAETGGGHWCGEPYDGGFVTYCAFLPPTLAWHAPPAP
jgi:hypothetical protein